MALLWSHLLSRPEGSLLSVYPRQATAGEKVAVISADKLELD